MGTKKCPLYLFARNMLYSLSYLVVRWGEQRLRMEGAQFKVVYAITVTDVP